MFRSLTEDDFLHTQQVWGRLARTQTYQNLSQKYFLRSILRIQTPETTTKKLIFNKNDLVYFWYFHLIMHL